MPTGPFTYTKSPVAMDKIQRDILASTISIALDGGPTFLAPDQLTIAFKADLSTDEKDTLDALVAAHDGVPLEFPSAAQLITTGKVDPILGRQVFSASAFAINIDYEVKARGFSGTAAHGATTNIDVAIGAEDRYINGLEILAQGAAMGDVINFKVVDVDNLLGYGAGLVVKQFGFTWNVAPDKSSQGPIVFNYLARIPAGFYVRLAYVSVGTADVAVGCNLWLHRKVP